MYGVFVSLTNLEALDGEPACSVSLFSGEFPLTGQIPAEGLMSSGEVTFVTLQSMLCQDLRLRE